VWFLDDAIYAMNSGEVSKAPVKLNENYFVFGVTKRTDADMAEFNKQRDSLMQAALDDRKRQVFDDYLAAAQQRMQNEGRIKSTRRCSIALPKKNLRPRRPHVVGHVCRLRNKTFRRR